MDLGVEDRHLQSSEGAANVQVGAVGIVGLEPTTRGLKGFSFCGTTENQPEPAGTAATHVAAGQRLDSG